MSKENVKIKDGFTQVCVIHGCTLGDTTPEEFEKVINREFDVRTQFLEVITTLPDKSSDGRDVPDTGGRSDILFAVHGDDITGPFCVRRLQAGIRWIEDAVSAVNNPNGIIYPERVRGYCRWDGDDHGDEGNLSAGRKPENE